MKPHYLLLLVLIALFGCNNGPSAEETEAKAQLNNKVAKDQIRSRISASVSYESGWLGGLSNVVVKCCNNSVFKMSKVSVKLQYILADGSILQNESIIIKDIDSGECLTVPAPNTDRGTTIKCAAVMAMAMSETIHGCIDLRSPEGDSDFECEWND